MKNVTKVNILIVDDQPANLMALAETLAPLSQNIITALSGEEALKHLLKQDFAVILLDVQMPTMDGFELAKIIHSRPATCHTPIVFITAISREQIYILQGYSVGAIDYLVKPIIPEILISKVTCFIDLFNKNLALKEQTKQLQAANIALQEKQEEISRINHQKELILNAVGEGIYGVNSQGETTFLNPAASKMLGYTLEEVMGKPECLILHPDLIHNDNISGKCPICTSLKDGCIHCDYEAKFQRKDGSYFPVEYISMPVVEKGKIIGAVITFKDITERCNLEKMKEDFIAIASHELRNPVTLIYGNLELLNRVNYQEKPEKAKKMLDAALQASNRLLKLTKNILDIQRLNTGKFILNKQICIVFDLMQQAINDVQSLADQYKIILKFEPVYTPVWADANALVQVITNLLSNAIKFSLPNTIVYLSAEVITNPDRVPQSCHTQLSLPSLLFKIEDQGRGIPPDKLEIIFERFQQLDVADARAKGGSGLGLAICKSIIKQHDGFIWVESILEQGSIFYFTLPLSNNVDIH